MNEKWPQQEVFCEKVKDFCRKHGYLTSRGAVRLSDVSKLFQVSEETLRQLLHYKSKGRPSYDRLAHIARVTGSSLTAFTGAAGDSPPGVAQDEWNDLSDRERGFASEVLKDVLSDEMTADEKDELYAAYREARERLLRLKRMWSQ
jgi:transcriptional regulator with XRE-family HTH domain